MQRQAEGGDVQGEVEERPQQRREWSGGLLSVVLPLLIAAVVTLGLWYWQQRGSAPDVIDQPTGIVGLPADRNPTGRPPAPEVGRAAPDFLLDRVDAAGPLRLSDLQGQPVLLVFWATWCDACRALVSELDQLHAQGEVTVVGVALQEPREQVSRFVREFGLTYPVVLDQEGELAAIWPLDGPEQGLPVSYLIDASGVVAARFSGPVAGAELRAALQAVEGQ